MGDALGVLGTMAYVAGLGVLVWGISRAASRYVRRKSGRVVTGGFWGDLKDAVVSIGSAIGALVTGLAGCLGSLIGCVLFLVLGLIGLFFVVWLVKRMWEAA